MSSNEYLVYSPQPFTTRASCLNGSSYTADFGQTTKLTVPDGCFIKLKAHTLRVDEKFHVPLAPQISEWKWNPLELPADLLDRSVHLDFNLNSLSQRVNSLRNDSTLDSELPELVERHLSSHSRFAVLVWTLLSLSMLTPFFVAGWYYYRRRRRLSRPLRYAGHYVTLDQIQIQQRPLPAPRDLEHCHQLSDSSSAPPMYPRV
jgi:hypothetical protein